MERTCLDTVASKDVWPRSGYVSIGLKRRDCGTPSACVWPRMADQDERRTETTRQVRNGAWVEWLALKQYTRLRVVARRRGVAEQDVEDIVQEALSNVMRSFKGPDVEASVLDYACRAVENTALKAYRRRQRKESHNVAIGDERPGPLEERQTVRGIFDPSASDPLEQAIASQAASELRQKLDRLPEEQRLALILSAAGFGLAEVAARLGLSVRATRKRIEKGNRALREDER